MGKEDRSVGVGGSNGTQSTETWPVLVIGGGPAGLTGAYELLKLVPDMRPLVVEAGSRVGGIARTEEYKGYRFDIGGHRFFTKVKPVEELWHEIMGDEMIDVPRSSRIYYRGKFYDYPLSIGNALGNLGLYESARVAISFAKWKLFPSKEEDNFEQWVSNRFGGRLYWHFFRTYTEKVWGIPPTEIRADWAAQRIKDLSLVKAVVDALTGKGDTASLIKTFKYPRLGPGQMWETAAELIEKRCGEVRLETKATRIYRDGNRITGADILSRSGDTAHVDCEYILNSMPITELVRCITPAAPDHVLEAANKLKYRDFLIVTLVLDYADPFADNWIYIHSPDVKVGRIQNFRAWSPAMLPNQNTASIGMEYFCHEGDGLWSSTNEELLELAKRELERLELAPASSVIDGTVIRQPKAYPVYDADYKANLDIIKDWLLTFENLQSVGRNGMHRYNNQDHSMLAAMLAARNIAGESHDIWTVNVERSYHEEFVVDKRKNKSSATPTDSESDNGTERRVPISVVIPVHNAGDRLQQVILAVLESSDSPAEIILVDDASDDNAIERAVALDGRIRMIRTGDSPVGPAAARNAGVQAATQETIVFIDSDVLAHSDTLRCLVEPLESESGVVASFGSYDDSPQASGIASAYANLRHHFVHQGAESEATTFWSGLGAVRREAFLSAGGFDHAFRRPSIEDIDLGVRLKHEGRIKLVKSAQAKHLKRWNLLGLWRTDICERAIPWGRLAVEHEDLHSALNSSRHEKFSALLILIALLALLASPLLISTQGAAVAIGAVIAPAAIWLWLNRELIRSLSKHGGLPAAVGGTLLHAAYYLYAPAAFLGSVTWHRWVNWMRSPDRSLAYTLVLSMMLLTIGATGLAMLTLGLIGTQSLFDWLVSLQGEAVRSRYNLESLSSVQSRLVSVGSVLLGATAYLVYFGPKRLIGEAREAMGSIREVFTLSKPEWIFVGCLTLIAIVLWGMFLGQQMRLDEASSFAMYATASPLVPLLTYETPNNHILHSILMWASVNLFGPSEWAARLPAFLASICIPLGILAASRNLLSPMIAAIGAGLYTGSTISADIATNARGYPFVICAMLILIGLLPALRNRRPGAITAAVLVGAFGLYACPVMAYPLACVLGAWCFAGPAKGTTPLEHVSILSRTAIGTGVVAALLYAPAWALRTGTGPLESLSRAARGYREPRGFFRFDELTYNLHAAWSQWTWPAQSLIAIATFVVALAGLWMWLSRPGWPRAVVIGLLTGSLSVYLITRLAPPPWWIMVWCVPLLALLIATPLAYLAVLISPRSSTRYAAGLVALAIPAMVLIRSPYPEKFPYRMGTKDAPAIAEALSETDIKATTIVTSPDWYRLLNFELETRGHGREVSVPISSLTAPQRERLVHVRAADPDQDPELHTLQPDIKNTLTLESSQQVGNSVIDTYRARSMNAP